MPHYIIELRDGDARWLLEWSTVVDAPITFGMSEPEFLAYYREQHGERALAGLPERLARVAKAGTSALTWTLDGLLSTYWDHEHPEFSAHAFHARHGADYMEHLRAHLVEAFCRKMVGWGEGGRA